MGKKQMEIEGTERPNSIPELDAAAEKFKASSKKRKRAQDNEIADRETVIQLMRTHKLTVYEDTDAGLIITLSAKETVKVEDMNESDEDADEPGEVVPLREIDKLPSTKATPEA